MSFKKFIDERDGRLFVLSLWYIFLLLLVVSTVYFLLAWNWSAPVVFGVVTVIMLGFALLDSIVKVAINQISKESQSYNREE